MGDSRVNASRWRTPPTHQPRNGPRARHFQSLTDRELVLGNRRAAHYDPDAIAIAGGAVLGDSLKLHK